MQLGISRRRRRERLHTQHSAVRIDRGCNMHISMRVDSARHRARALYDGHRHPFSLNGQGVARTSREGDRDEHAARTANSVTLRNGACPIRTTRGDRQAPNEPQCSTSQTNTGALNVAASINTTADPNSTTTSSLADLYAPSASGNSVQQLGTVGVRRSERRDRGLSPSVPVGDLTNHPARRCRRAASRHSMAIAPSRLLSLASPMWPWSSALQSIISSTSRNTSVKSSIVKLIWATFLLNIRAQHVFPTPSRARWHPSHFRSVDDDGTICTPSEF